MANPSDIMTAITAMLMGLRQNIDMTRQEELKALQLAGSIPGMTIAPAEGSPALTNPFLRLLGAPTYQPGAGGMPIVPLGSSAFTVKKQPSTMDFFNTLYPAAAPTSATAEADEDDISTGGTAVRTPPLALGPANVAARTRRLTRGVDDVSREELLNDPTIVALLRQPGDQSLALGKRRQEIVKDRRAAASDRLTQQEKALELIGRHYHTVRDQASLDAANARLAEILPEAIVATLPTLYTPHDIASVLQGTQSVRDLRAPERAAAIARAETPYKVQQGLEIAKAVDPVKAQIALEKFRKEEAIRTEEAGRRFDVLSPKRVEEEAQTLERTAPIRKDIAAATGAEAAKITTRAQTQAAIDKDRLKEVEGAAAAGEKTLETFDEVKRMIREGVYTTGARDLGIMKAYESGLFYQNDPKAHRTARLRELGAQLVLAMSPSGNLGGQLSDSDRQQYELASGRFQRAKSLGEMEESIASMERIARKAILKANTTLGGYQATGKLPPREIPGTAAPTAPAAPTTPPGLPNVILKPGEQGPSDLPKITREQAIELLMQQPLPNGRLRTRQQAEQFIAEQEQKLQQQTR